MLKTSDPACAAPPAGLFSICTQQYSQILVETHSAIKQHWSKGVLHNLLHVCRLQTVKATSSSRIEANYKKLLHSTCGLEIGKANVSGATLSRCCCCTSRTEVNASEMATARRFLQPATAGAKCFSQKIINEQMSSALFKHTDPWACLGFAMAS